VAQVLSFGPALLIEGAIQELPEKYFISTTTKAPRTAICQVGSLHYIFLVVDGRQEGYSMGASLNGLARIAESLGCIACYNLDGGGSSAMLFSGRIDQPPEQRRKDHRRNGASAISSISAEREMKS
jgi:exopolysaccharide biosynthesis protein